MKKFKFNLVLFRQHTETIEAMQQEVDNYENEVKELKKKIPKKINFPEPNVTTIQPTNTPAVAVNFTDPSVYAQEV